MVSVNVFAQILNMTRITLAVSYTAVMVASCATRTVATQSPADDEFFKYIVSGPGENLERISKWYCDDESSWSQFFIPSARDQKTLHPGDTILIPTRLMRRKDPIDVNFIGLKQATPAPRHAATYGLSEVSDGPDTVDNDKKVQEDFLDAFSKPLLETVEKNK